MQAKMCDRSILISIPTTDALIPFSMFFLNLVLVYSRHSIRPPHTDTDTHTHIQTHTHTRSYKKMGAGMIFALLFLPRVSIECRSVVVTSSQSMCTLSMTTTITNPSRKKNIPCLLQLLSSVRRTKKTGEENPPE